MQTSAAAPGATATAPPSELTALLLEVLRGVDREVKTRPKLEGVALLAVEHYRDIAEDLATLPENSINNAGKGDSPAQH